MTIKAEIINIDSKAFLEEYTGKKFDCIVTSPPYNLGTIGGSYKGPQYDVYNDDVNEKEYRNKIITILSLAAKNVKKSGSIYVNIKSRVKNSRLVPPFWLIDEMEKQSNFYLKHIIIWNYSAGPDVSNKRWNSRYEFIFHFVQDVKYYFNLDRVRVKTKYSEDKRYDKKGKNPSNVWYISDLFSEDECNEQGIMYLPHLTWNNPERANHPAQFPIALPVRCLAASCPKNGLVYDPFAGVGTTLTAAMLLNLNSLGTELSKNYCEQAKERIELTRQANYSWSSLQEKLKQMTLMSFSDDNNQTSLDEFF